MGVDLIVGFAGKARAGKSEAGQRLVDKWGFTQFAFADQMRSMALALDPVIDWYVDGTGRRLSDLVQADGWEIAKQNPEVRRFLQALGTEGVRAHLGDDSWIRATDKAIAEAGNPDAVVTDVRFPNEAAFIRESGGLVIRVRRLNEDLSPFDNGLGSGHASEALTDMLMVDHNIVNVDGHLEDFLKDVDDVIAATY